MNIDTPSGINRRETLKRLGWMAAGVAGGGLLPRWAASRPTLRPGRAYGRVYQMHSPGLLGRDGDVDASRAFSLLDGALRGLSGASTSESAWKSLFQPDDVVGIKLNCMAPRPLSPHPGLIDALVQGLGLAGIPPRHIIVWDRSNRELKSAGFPIRTSGGPYLSYGTDHVGYEDEPSILGRIGGCFSTILRRVSALINVPVLKDHDMAGVSLGMKNFYGAIHNPNKYHDSQCNPYIADLNRHPYIDGKLRLIVCDAAIAVFHGGPGFTRRWSWTMDSLLVATDPVALDRIGAAIIEERRREAGLPSLRESGREPLWIETAASAGLGEGNMEKIRVIREQRG